jgi:hypothetical protein
MIAKIFETSRFIIIAGGALICYHLFANNAILLLHYLTICVVFALSFLTGIEGLFFAKYTAQSLGRKTGGMYQFQSAMNNLAVGSIAIVVFIADWGRYADATILLASITFITLSSLVHTWEAIFSDNKNLKNKLRGIWTLCLLALCIPVLVNALMYH